VRRVLFSLIAVTVVLAMVLAIGVLVMVRKPMPDTAGQVVLPGLDGEVVVQRDAYGVPQITADTPEDLFFAQGYVHAQDRFHEMDVRRHVAASRLAELIGSDGKGPDRLVKALGIRKRAQRDARTLPPGPRHALEAYARGVNAYSVGRSGSSLALEYSAKTLVGRDYRPDPWRPVDSMAWLQLLDWSLASGVTDEIDRILIARHMPLARVSELYPGTTPEPKAAARQRAVFADPSIVPVLLGLRESVAAVSRITGIPGDQGTDASVTDGALTARLGSAVAVPSPWYQVGLHCRRVTVRCPYDVTGLSLSAMPGVIVGSNRLMAWGFSPTALRPASLEVVRRPAAADGPIVAALPDHKALALRWDRLAERPSVAGVLALDQARSPAGVQSAAARLRLPFAVVYLDAHGSSGRFPSGPGPRPMSDHSLAADLLVPHLLNQRLATQFAEDGQKTLVGWDHRMSAGHPAAAYFAAVWRNLLAKTFHDEVPQAQWPDGSDRWIAVVGKLLATPNASWWDDLSTPQVVESRDDVLRLAMMEARDDLTRIRARDLREWDWADLHGPTLENPTLSGRLFERGPVPLSGSGDTAVATYWNPAAGYVTTAAPVARFTADPRNPERSRWIVATGVSGHPFARHYTDQLDLWARGELVSWPASASARAHAAEEELRLASPARRP
jgi:acyl-homoserine lactone acylase PvdQ